MKMLRRLFSYATHVAWLNVGLRSGMALFGGYGVALLSAAALAGGLPLPRSDAAALAIMLAFLLHAAIAVWIFAAATLSRAVMGLLLPTFLFGIWFTLMTLKVST